jgi:hypothetical protein
MAFIFLLLAVLTGVVLADAVLENTGAATVTLFNRSFDQLSFGELLLVAAGLGFLILLFLFLAFGSSRARRMRRRERREANRDLEAHVEDLERDNARMRQELGRRRETAPAGANQPAAAAASGRSGPPPAGPEPLRSRRERLDDRAEPVAPLRRPPSSTDEGF